MSIQEFELTHPSGVFVSRRLSEQELVASLPSVSATRRDMKTGWVWYSLPPFPDDGVQLSLALGFDLGALRLLQISDSNPDFGTDWGNWSEEKELARVASVAKWLSRHGWPSGRYPWGGVSAEFDPRSGSGLGGVRFA